MTDHSQGHGTVHVRRPSPALIREIGRRLSETVDRVRYSALVVAVQYEAGAPGRRPAVQRKTSCTTSWSS